MRFKDLLTVSENKKTKQINLAIKKKKLSKIGFSIDELLNMKLKRSKIK